MTLKAEYLGASVSQVRWGSGDDPRRLLDVGKVYTVIQREVHSMHTVLHLGEYPGKKFNSVCFREFES